MEVPPFYRRRKVFCDKTGFFEYVMIHVDVMDPRTSLSSYIEYLRTLKPMNLWEARTMYNCHHQSLMLSMQKRRPDWFLPENERCVLQILQNEPWFMWPLNWLQLSSSMKRMYHGAECQDDLHSNLPHWLLRMFLKQSSFRDPDNNNQQEEEPVRYQQMFQRSQVSFSLYSHSPPLYTYSLFPDGSIKL